MRRRLRQAILRVSPRRLLALGLLAIAAATTWFWLPRPAPGIRVTGHVSAGGQPVAQLGLQFKTGDQGGRPVMARTGTDGGYEAVLLPDTAYKVEVFPIDHLPAGSFEVQTGASDEILDLEVPDTRFRFARPPSDGLASPVTWQVSLYNVGDGLAGGSDLAGFISDRAFDSEIVGLPAGQWMLFLDSGPDHTGSAKEPVILSEGMATATVDVVSRAGVAGLAVQDAAGQTLPSVVVWAGVRSYRSDPQTGIVALPRASPGIPAIVTAPGFVPRCVMAPDLGTQREVRLTRPPPTPLMLTIGPETAWPLGLFAGPEDECLVPGRFFESAVVDEAEIAMTVQVGVGSGAYRFRPGRTGPMSAAFDPTKAQAFHAPLGCTACIADYRVGLKRMTTPHVVKSTER